MTKRLQFYFASTTGLLLCGCASLPRVDLERRTGGSAALFGQFQAYDGASGRRIAFADVVRRCRAADVVLFGEQHSDSVCNQLEAQLLAALAADRRPVALAMEFFERDTQASLDAYLANRIDEAAFREQTRQKRAYALSHRPLIELCRSAKVPVIAANVPRRLLRAYSRSNLEFDVYRAQAEPADQRWLPRSNELIEGRYRDRFMEIMKRHPPPTSRPAKALTSAPTSPTTTRPAGSQPPKERARRSFLAQLLWDSTMSESVADFRATYPRRRVLLIVGSFHVAYEGGTQAKLRERRPDDRVVTIVYRDDPTGRFELAADDRDAGDIVIYGIAPPPKAPARPPAPTTAPATSGERPASAPTTSAPATATAASSPLDR